MYYSVPDKIINSLQRVAAFEGNQVTEIKEKITGICLKHIKNENLQNGMMHLQIEQLHTASSSRSLQRVERSAVLSQTHRKNREKLSRQNNITIHLQGKRFGQTECL